MRSRRPSSGGFGERGGGRRRGFRGQARSASPQWAVNGGNAVACEAGRSRRSTYLKKKVHWRTFREKKETRDVQKDAQGCDKELERIESAARV